MYDWWLAAELAELRQQETARKAEVHRVRAEALEERGRGHPSLLRRIVSLLSTPEEPLTARNAVEAELLGALRAEEEVRSRAA